MREGPEAGSSVAILPANVSRITFERMGRWPEPGWQVPRSIAFSPDGRLVTYLQSPSGDERMALFAFDLATRQVSVLLRWEDLGRTAAPLPREEELRRERQRQRAQGITSYAWALRAPLVVVPYGGDVYARLADGSLTRLTDTPAAEIDPKPCATGERVAYVRGGELFSVDVASKREAQLTRGATTGLTHGQSDFNGQEEFDEPSGFFWSPSCDRLAYLEVDERKVEELAVAGYRDGRPDVMMQRYPRAGKTNPSVRIGLVDLATQTTRWVAPYPHDDSEHYFGRFAWTADGATLVFQALSRAQTRRDVLAYDVETRATRVVATESGPAWVAFTDLKLFDHSRELVWARDDGGYRHLELLQLDGPGERHRLTSGPWDVTRIDGVDEQARRVVFTATRESPLERRPYSASLDHPDDVRSLHAQHGVHALTLDPTAKLSVDVHSATTRPPSVEVSALTGTQLAQLPVALDTDFAELDLRAPEPVSLKSGSGETLHGQILRPRVVSPGKRYPAVVMVYGGPGVQMVQDRWSARLAWQHLADRGVVVFQLDNRGTPGRGRAFETAIHGHLGQIELEDQLVGADYLSRLPEVDGTRLGIYGHSYGGYMAVLAMLKAAPRFRVAVAGSPVSDWSLYDSGYTERYLGTPEQHPDWFSASSAIPLAPRLTGKLLILHALMDENVHFTGTAKLIDAFAAAGKPFDLLVFPGERHGYQNPAAKSYSWQRVLEYLTDHL